MVWLDSALVSTPPRLLGRAFSIPVESYSLFFGAATHRDDPAA
jgi:hypothetical protein